jgi:hypothetical protein
MKRKITPIMKNIPFTTSRFFFELLMKQIYYTIFSDASGKLLKFFFQWFIVFFAVFALVGAFGSKLNIRLAMELSIVAQQTQF